MTGSRRGRCGRGLRRVLCVWLFSLIFLLLIFDFRAIHSHPFMSLRLITVVAVLFGLGISSVVLSRPRARVWATWALFAFGILSFIVTAKYEPSEEKMIPSQRALSSFAIMTPSMALQSGQISLLRIHCGYGGRLGTWNALPHIVGILRTETYSIGLLPVDWKMAGLLVVPNYWKPGAADWRGFRLAPWQRINRLWGMWHLSRKETLVRTLNSHFGAGKCPFTPQTFFWAEIRTSSRYAQILATQDSWLIKTTAHRGAGVCLVKASALLAAEKDMSSIASGSRGLQPQPSLGSSLLTEMVDPMVFARWLWSHRSHALLQRAILDPFLVDGRKSSLRLYSLVTSAHPLRVYLHLEGFALFASRRYGAADGAAADPRAFLTNAAQNRHGAPVVAEGGADGNGKGRLDLGNGRSKSSLAPDHALAQSLGLGLPNDRWTLQDFLTFAEARYAESRPGGSVAASASRPYRRPGWLRRALEKIVLHTYVAGQPKLMQAASESLAQLGLAGAHDYAGTFELAAVDIMLDATYRPWLLEVNTSPSMQQELKNAGQRAGVASGDSRGAGDRAPFEADLPIKQRVLRDMLSLAGALPEGQGREPPEASLAELFGANDRGENATQGALACRRPWRLGNCQHCPRWPEVVELWRAAAERRRAGGFVPLAPSADVEWNALAATHLAAVRTMGDAISPKAQTERTQGPSGRPLIPELLTAWVHTAGGGENVCHQDVSSPQRRATQEACVRRRWEAMLCS